MGNLNNIPGAFPSIDGQWQEGMALLDYFAAKAMQAFLSNGNTYYKDIPKIAYDLAQLMMEESEKRL
jgi:hypothetical protein